MNPNQDIIDALQHIAESYRSQGVVYKYKAYRTAIVSIRGVGTRITAASQIKHLPGVGTAMLQKVEEILATGQLEQERVVMSDPVTQAISLFTSVHGIGPVLAKKLVHDHGLRTLDDLEERAQGLLPPQARLGLKHVADASQRIPFDEVEAHLQYIKPIVHRLVDPRLQLCVCGSHRRGASASGDVDVLITHPAADSSATESEFTFLEAVCAVLRDQGYIVDTLVEGRSKFMGYAKLPFTPFAVVRRLDLRWLPYDSFFPALLYFTGSDMFNVMMRTEALKRGFTLNEYGMYEVEGYEHLHNLPTPQNGLMSPLGSPNKKGEATTAPAGAQKGKRVLVKSERDIFDKIGMQFVLPCDRNR